jgi:hypothetical protein
MDGGKIVKDETEDGRSNEVFWWFMLAAILIGLVML